MDLGPFFVAKAWRYSAIDVKDGAGGMTKVSTYASREKGNYIAVKRRDYIEIVNITKIRAPWAEVLPLAEARERQRQQDLLASQLNEEAALLNTQIMQAKLNLVGAKRDAIERGWSHPDTYLSQSRLRTERTFLDALLTFATEHGFVYDSLRS